MYRVLTGLRRKYRTFEVVCRQGGLRLALKVTRASLYNSVVYWAARSPLHLRLPLPQSSAPWRPVPSTDDVVSVVVPVYNTPAWMLKECFESVLRQSHKAWELCVCDDCSTDPETVAVLASYRGSDARIRIVRSDRNLGIAGATDLAAEQASGRFLAMLDHDDTLHPQALAEIAHAAKTLPDCDLMYTDEDKIEPDGSYAEPYYKPDWSPEHLQSVMYVLHCLTIRKALFWRLGGMRSEFDGAQDYDLALRAGRVARRVHHIPHVLYHWRKLPGSAAAEVDAKPAALAAGHRALADHAAALDADAVVEPGLLPGTFRLRRSLAGQPPVTLVILTADPPVDSETGTARPLAAFLRSIAERSTYEPIRLLVVDDGEVSQESARLIEELGARRASFADPRREEEGFNFARKANYALSLVDTDLVVLLNDDLEVVSPGWVEALIEPLMDPGVAFVGARLVSPDGTLQHGGLVIGVNGGATHVFYGRPADEIGYCGFTHLIRNYSAVTGAVFATRRDVLDALGPFDEALAHDYNDVDLCLRAVARGYRVVYTPHAELVHLEGASLRRRSQDAHEVALFAERWADVMRRDPYYNPNLSRDRADYRI